MFKALALTSLLILATQAMGAAVERSAILGPGPECIHENGSLYCPGGKRAAPTPTYTPCGTGTGQYNCPIQTITARAPEQTFTPCGTGTGQYNCPNQPITQRDTPITSYNPGGPIITATPEKRSSFSINGGVGPVCHSAGHSGPGIICPSHWP